MPVTKRRSERRSQLDPPSQYTLYREAVQFDAKEELRSKDQTIHDLNERKNTLMFINFNLINANENLTNSKNDLARNLQEQQQYNKFLTDKSFKKRRRNRSTAN